MFTENTNSVLEFLEVILDHDANSILAKDPKEMLNKTFEDLNKTLPRC